MHHFGNGSSLWPGFVQWPALWANASHPVHPGFIGSPSAPQGSAAGPVPQLKSHRGEWGPCFSSGAGTQGYTVPKAGSSQVLRSLCGGHLCVWGGGHCCSFPGLSTLEEQLPSWGAPKARSSHGPCGGPVALHALGPVTHFPWASGVSNPPLHPSRESTVGGQL